MQDGILAVMQSSNLYVYCLSNPIRYIDPNGLAVWLIHGTWKDEDAWHPNFSRYLVGKNGPFKNEYLGYGNWGGNNNVRSRAEGAAAIVNQIISWRNESDANKNESIRLVGHSHGGNVAILVANTLAAQSTPIHVDTLITIGTPVRADYQLTSGAVGQHINVYNNLDAVQIAGGQYITSSRGMNTWIPAGRTFTNANNVEIPTNWWQNPISAHQFMHDNITVWNNHIKWRVR